MLDHDDLIDRRVEKGDDGYLGGRSLWQRLSKFTQSLSAAILVALASSSHAAPRHEGPSEWSSEWPRTNFSKHSVLLNEIISGGPPRGGIPAIMTPQFSATAEVSDLGPREPVISVAIGDDWRAYPLRILMRHEIVNDVVGGIPLAITYCPLCNSALVFDRRLDGKTLTFNTTGKLRHSDLVMFDLETESWWQQFVGQAIVGHLVGAQLHVLPSRIESFALFKERSSHIKGARVLVPDPSLSSFRAYDRNPYVYYDTGNRPPLYFGKLPVGVPPLERVVAVSGEAWTLPLIQGKRTVNVGDLRISWQPGQSSPLDTPAIDQGHDIGNVIVQRRVDGSWRDEVYDVSFAFAFHAFYPDGIIHDIDR